MRKVTHIRFLVILVMLHTGWAHAASFDCRSAKTKVEHLVCDHAELGHLDDQMGRNFETTLSEAADQSSLLQTQRAWINTLNRCTDVACLAQSYSDRLAALNNVKPAGWKTYSDPDLGVSFEYLGNREVKKPCPRRFDQRCVALVGRNMGISDYIIAFEVANGTLEKVATDQGGFALDDGKWVAVGGPGVAEEVETFSGRGWKGMRITRACEVFDPESGPHTGGCFNAVISNGTRAVVVDTEGSIGDDADTARSVESIRFTK